MRAARSPLPSLLKTGVGLLSLLVPDEVTAELHADVSIGHEVRGHGPLDETVVGGGLQPLEADGRLEFAGGQRQPGLESRSNESVLHDRLAAAEVGHQLEVIDVV